MLLSSVAVDWKIVKNYSTNLDSNDKPDRLSFTLSCKFYNFIFPSNHLLIGFHSLALTTIFVTHWLLVSLSLSLSS